MKRSKRKATQKRAQTQPAQPQNSRKMTRRDLMGWAKFGALGGAVFLGGGYYFVSQVMAGIAESDLTKVGNGIPTIVQVHDPSCPTCRALQSETRKALKHFEDGQIQYLVAHLNQEDGRAFAGQHGAGRMTLLLLDGQGRVRDRVQGRTPERMLIPIFERHLRASGAPSG